MAPRVVLPLAFAICATASPRKGYVSSVPWLPRVPVVKSRTAEQLLSDVDLPKEFDWRNVNGMNYVTNDMNQHIPEYCGSCWIHGTVSALNDRIKIARKAKYPDVMLGRQSILNCVPAADGESPPPGCDGGDSWMIHKYLHENRVPDQTCLPYQAKTMACAPENICRNCVPDEMVNASGPFKEACFPVKNWIGYGVKEYGNLTGETPMMKEILARGPIACQFATDDDFMLSYARGVGQDGVYITEKKFTAADIDHVMEVAGWGETEAGQKYWVVRNSWGTWTGHLGWVKIRRGVDQMLSESGGCDWAVPDFHELEKAMNEDVQGDYVHGVSVQTQGSRSGAMVV